MSEAAHSKGHEYAPGEHEYHFLEASERSDIGIGDFGYHEHTPGEDESQHFIEAVDSSGISEQST